MLKRLRGTALQGEREARNQASSNKRISIVLQLHSTDNAAKTLSCQTEQLKADRSFAVMKLDKCSGDKDFEDRPFVLIKNRAGYPTLWMRVESIYETWTSPNGSCLWRTSDCR
ncbi:hypothetical protein B9Z55_027109 [Caenorhabditis nigoni]|nr:hypothetical protein B9Z55_027109 [Caenorhabditis nigoni]